MGDIPQPVAVSANTGTDTDVATPNSRSLRLGRSRVAPATSGRAWRGKRGHQALAGAITCALAFPAYADRFEWGLDAGFEVPSFIETFPGEGMGHVASLSYRNEMNWGANNLTRVLVEGVEITVTVNDAGGDAPDTITISVPDGFIAIPSSLTVGEGETGNAEIFEASEVPLG